MFNAAVGSVEFYPMTKIQELLDNLAASGFFDRTITDKEEAALIAALNGATAADDTIDVTPRGIGSRWPRSSATP